MTLSPALPQEHLFEALQESAQPGQYARQYLEQGQERLNQAFEDTDITELVRARAELVDQVMVAAWSLFGLADRDDLSLVAVGGYGRAELHPCSDVDVLVLMAEAPDQSLRDSLERFVAFLWDMGLEIGHAVRTLDECVELAREDITVATNIMEARAPWAVTTAFANSWKNAPVRNICGTPRRSLRPNGRNRWPATSASMTPNTTWNRI